MIDKRRIKNMVFKVPALYWLLYRVFLVINGIRSFLKYRDARFFTGVSMEISTFCNRKCYYCPNSKHLTPTRFMDRTVYETVIHELACIGFDGVLSYVLYNEPLLDKRLPELVSYSKSKLPRCYQKIITNGDYLTGELCEKLIACGVDEFYITLHDYDPQPLLAKLEYVLRRFGSYITLDTIHDKQLSNRGGLVSSLVVSKVAKSCPNTQSLIVDYKGNVLLCCDDYFHAHKMGNIMERPILEIWRSFAGLRRRIRSGRYDLEICKKCRGEIQ